MRALTYSRGESGFSLPLAVLVMAVLLPLGLFGFALARQELRTHTRGNSAAIAFYAAETGLGRALEFWDRPEIAETGVPFAVTEGTLDNGASYRVEATLLDDASNVHGLFSIRSEGRAPNGVTQQTGLMVATISLGSPTKGALRSLERVRVAGKAEVNGLDMVPTTWADDCPPDLVDEAGITMADTTRMTKSGGAQVQGAPPIAADTDTTGYFNFGDITYDEVASLANITLPDGTNISGSEPVATYTADGSCDTSNDSNWGEPEADNQPCSDWFPIIHAPGNLTLSGSGAGQGILLVDGDLSICGGATFYGPVVVKGVVKSCGSGFQMIGGVVAGESDLNPSGGMVVGASQIQYSACVVQRAISRSRAGRPRPLAERPWFQQR